MVWALGPGLPSRSGLRGRGRGAVVYGRKREETGSLTAAASSPETAANSAVEFPGPAAGLGPAQLAGQRRWGAGVLGSAREEGV